jgi:hypothetical protein
MPLRGKYAAILLPILLLGLAACATNDTAASDRTTFKPYVGGSIGTSVGQ